MTPVGAASSDVDGRSLGDARTEALTPDLVGLELGPYEVSWDVDDVILYALGIGARPDDELDLLYEGHGPTVFPTFATIPAMVFVDPLMRTVDANWAASVHGAQRIEIVRDRIPPSADARTTARIIELWDKKSAALFVIESRTEDDDGVLFAVRATLFVPGSGGFGGDRGPRGSGDATAAPTTAPDMEITLGTQPEQAAVYRLSGDRNPLHIDPVVANELGFDRPILHGLCTFGFGARALVAGVANGDPTRLRRISGRFTSPTYAGELLRTRIWGEEEGVRFEMRDERGRIVLANGSADFTIRSGG